MSPFRRNRSMHPPAPEADHSRGDLRRKPARSAEIASSEQIVGPALLAQGTWEEAPRDASRLRDSRLSR